MNGVKGRDLTVSRKEVNDLLSKKKYWLREEGDISIQVWRFSGWDVVILNFILQFRDKHAMLFLKMLFFLVKSLQYKVKGTIITSQLYLDYLPPTNLNVCGPESTFAYHTR